jgi:hypothetical protein
MNYYVSCSRAIMTSLTLLVAVTFLSFNTMAQTASDELTKRMSLWEKAALLCNADSIEFPTKQHAATAQPCDDGDMTLFNGLLCAAGDSRGCKGVRESQDPASGLWHRSPRIRLLGKNDQGNADSSPDMAIGTQLYLVVSQDRIGAQKWLRWINDNTPCLIKIGNGCVLHGVPQFCLTQDCIIRPQDAATLAATVSFLQKSTGMAPLTDGRLRGMLGTFSDYGAVAQDIAARVNDLGFSQHLVGVSIWLLRLVGSTDQSQDLSAATLAKRNPGNAFFSLLAGKGKEQVLEDTLARCPADPATLVRPLNQWQSERSSEPNKDTGLYAWQQSSLWDCIFMGRIIGTL